MGDIKEKFRIDKIDLIENNKEPIVVGLVTLLALFALYYAFYTPPMDCTELCQTKGFKAAESSQCKKVTECESPGYPVPNPFNPECDGISSCCCTQPTCEAICESQGYSGATNKSCTSLYNCESPNVPVTSESCSGVEGCCCVD